jgi:RecJ-like exonuclease
MKKFKIIGLIALLAAIAFLMAGCPISIPCSVCDGTGICDSCHGNWPNNIVDGYTGLPIKECPECHGTGKCPNCKGTGNINPMDL